MKIIDLNFHANNDLNSIHAAITAHKPALGYADFFTAKAKLTIIKHLANKEDKIINGVRYVSLKSRNRFTYIPLKTLAFVKKEKPDVVIVQGLLFPLQLIALRILLNKKTAIITQHHAERPFKGIKKYFQKIACAMTDAFIFTALGNAKEWVDKKILPIEKCNEVLEGSTDFIPRDKIASEIRRGVEGVHTFLWVKRLDVIKDPITVLKGFEKYLLANPDARLYMIYQEDQLLPVVKDIVNNNELLKKAVTLVGKINHDELPYWYSAADYFICGSHSEGSGYSLIEAMACGCIPIITDIPSYRKITGNGEYGFLYTPGDAESLSTILSKLKNISKTEYSKLVTAYFQLDLSFQKIADDIYNICGNIMHNKK